MDYRPKVGVGVIIRNNGRYLLLKRHNSHGTGTWSPPGGHLEYAETLEQCAIRETMEETSLVVEEVAYIGITNDYFCEENKHYITVWMEGIRFKGVAKINSYQESSDIGWYQPEQLPTPLFLPFYKFINQNYYGSKSRHRQILS